MTSFKPALLKLFPLVTSFLVLVAFVGVAWGDGMCSAKCVCFVFRTKAAVKCMVQYGQALPETLWIHYAFDFELIFGCCTFRNLLLLPDFS